ncbi:MAG: tetratricopeptide repeat protein [Cyanobacteria bacterium P01_A01_bin.135]
MRYIASALRSKTLALGPRVAISAAIASSVALGPSQAAVPQTAEEYRQQGLSYRNQGRFDEAIAALEQSVALAPDHQGGQVILGWTQHLAGQQEPAARTLTQAVYRNPFDIPTLNALGIVHLVQGNLGQAVTSHLWAAHLQSDNEVAYFNLSLAAQRLTLYDWAIATAARAAELEPYNPHPLIAEAIALWSQDKLEDAQQRYREALDLSPRYGTPDLDFYLEQAAFSPEQIAIAYEIVETLTGESL